MRFRSTISLLVLLCGLSFLLGNAYSQQLGLKGGFNFSTIGGSADTVQYKYKPAAHIGAFVNFRASGNVSVQVELVYSNQGAWTQQNRDLSLRYNYLNLPVVFQLFTRRKLFFAGGAQLGFLINAKTRDGQYEVDISSQVNNFDFAIVAGMGYTITRKLSIDGRFNFGVSSLARRSQRFEFRSTNQVFQVSVAYML